MDKQELNDEQLIQVLFMGLGAALAQINPSGLNKGITIPDPRDDKKLCMVYTDEVGQHLLDGEEFEEFLAENYHADEIEDLGAFEIMFTSEHDDDSDDETDTKQTLQ
jgi:hypothetical protein